MRLDINLASHPYEDAKEFWQRWGMGLVVVGVVTLALLGFTAWRWHKAAKDRAEVARLEHNIAVLDGKLARSEATLNRPENRTLREQSNYLNNLFQQKAFSWTRIFEDLERVGDRADVQLGELMAPGHGISRIRMPNAELRKRESVGACTPVFLILHSVF